MSVFQRSAPYYNILTFFAAHLSEEEKTQMLGLDDDEPKGKQEETNNDWELDKELQEELEVCLIMIFYEQSFKSSCLLIVFVFGFFFDLKNYRTWC